MKAPIDKVYPNANPRNDILQIVVTTVCNEDCSNCTQLLPFRKDYKHMSVEVFRQAVRSMKGWPGVVAMFGGNPTCHPKFRELCLIMQEEIPNQSQRGLWTNNLLKNGEIARDTFFPHGRFNCNAHADPKAAALFDQWLPGKMIESTRTKPSWHSPILLDYRDYGISEADWIEARENCDINQKWSGAIVEREGKPFAYFCEVAAALDGVRGQNNGIEATPGWWRMPMMWFQDQVGKCCDAGCGVPLRRKGSLDAEEIYDISPSFLPLVKNQRAETNKAMIPSVEFQMHKSFPEATAEVTDYQAVRTAK